MKSPEAFRAGSPDGNDERRAAELSAVIFQAARGVHRGFGAKTGSAAP
jgi:hypothetical protein